MDFFKSDGTQSSNVMIPCTTYYLLSLQNVIPEILFS